MLTGETPPFHNTCFACGAQNPHGLHVRCTTSGTANSGTVVVNEQFQGYDGMVQGGIVATILDTAMVQLLRDVNGGSPVTGRLDIRYLAATPLNAALTVEARVIETRGTACWVVAQICHGPTCCATGRGVFKILHA